MRTTRSPADHGALHLEFAQVDAGRIRSEFPATMILQLLKARWPILLGAIIGAAVGYYGQCNSGTCIFSSTWWGGAITGVLIAALVTETARPGP